LLTCRFISEKSVYILIKSKILIKDLNSINQLIALIHKDMKNNYVT